MQPETLTLSVLESHLWEAANILRGSPVDRTDWKSYILPLMFFKRTCDVWDEEYEEAVKTYGEDFADEHRFQVPKGCYWNDVRGKTAGKGEYVADGLKVAIPTWQKSSLKLRDKIDKLMQVIINSINKG